MLDSGGALFNGRDDRRVARFTNVSLAATHEVLHPCKAGVCDALVPKTEFFGRSRQIVILIEKDVVSFFVTAAHEVEFKHVGNSNGQSIEGVE